MPVEMTVADRITQRLASRIGDHRYDMWFGGARVHVDGSEVCINTDSQFAADWIGSHFVGELRSAAQEAIGREASVSVRVAIAGAATAESDGHGNGHGNGIAGARNGQRNSRRATGDDAVAGKVERNGRAHRGPRDESPNHDAPVPARPNRTRGIRLRRLEDFIVGQCNRLAYSAALKLAEDGESSKIISPLFVHGECGVGKTHLLQGVCQRYSSLLRSPGAGGVSAVRYVTGEQFTNEFIAAVRNNTIEQFRDRIRRLDLLAIDDVHFLSNKTRTQHEFQCTLDAIQHMGARIILASDEHPRNIRRFSPGLINRLLSGMVVRIDSPDRETRTKLINRLAQSRGLRLSDAAASAIASRCTGSVREIEGAITKLAALHTLSNSNSKSEVGLVLVEQLFNDAGWKPSVPVRMSTIIEIVCARLAIAKGDVMGSGRNRRIVLARAAVAHLARTMTTMSYPEIAEALGRRHHSTVHTAAQRLREQIERNDRIEAGPNEHPLPVCELIDQLRHEISRATMAS